jgi:hypothetical protein
MDIGGLLSKLLGVRKAGANWQARCPAHDDRQANLEVSTGDHGQTRETGPDSIRRIKAREYLRLKEHEFVEWLKGRQTEAL